VVTKLLVGCVIRDKSGRVLLIHRNTAKLTQWELPGGKLESGEAPEAAAIREVQEEVGISVQITKLLGNTEFEDDGILWKYAWFNAEISGGEPQLGEPDRYDGMAYFDLLDSGLPARGISINISNLIDAIQNKQVRW